MQENFALNIIKYETRTEHRFSVFTAFMHQLLQDAINELHGKTLLGKTIKVDWAFVKPR